jgi:SAM-dependent methyltransferase
MPRICRVCGNTEGLVFYHPREMMFGTRERFDYFQCGACGCLQIESIPDDLGKYYPAGYFSFHDYHGLARSTVRARIERYRVDRALRRYGRRKTWWDKLVGPPPYMEWLHLTGVARDDPVLDIGCGSGKLLVRLGMGGFTDCTGVDPFLAEDIVYNDRVRVLKRDLEEFAEKSGQRYALVMLHHAFEHMRDPHRVLRTVVRLLRPGGWLLVRIPLADSFAWETYKENWVQLDAPRHLYLHTRKSMDYLAAAHGFQLERVLHDSTPSQILGSELYRRDIPLVESKKRKGSVLGRTARKAAETLTRELNETGRGDQAAFLLRRI